MADIGIKLGVDGEREFKKALTDINQQFKVLGSEMKLATSEFDKTEKSVGSLTSKNEVLAKQIDTQNDKITTLRSALENASDSFGETDKRAQQRLHYIFGRYSYKDGQNRKRATKPMAARLSSVRGNQD